MSKKGNNKRLKQAYAAIALNGRKMFWYGEDSEVFLAMSKDQLHEEFDGDILSELEAAHGDTAECEEIKNVTREMWRYCLYEEQAAGARQHKSGMFEVPVITFVGSYSPEYPVSQLFSSYI